MADLVHDEQAGHRVDLELVVHTALGAATALESRQLFEMLRSEAGVGLRIAWGA